MKIESQILLLIFCISFLFSCKNENKKEKVQYVLFSGNIKNHIDQKIKIYGDDTNFQKVIDINKNGSFSDTLKINSKGNYSFLIDQKRTNMYLDRGDQLHLSVDVKNFEQSIIFQGISSDINNYIIQKQILDQTFLLDHSTLFSKEVNEFKDQIREQKQTKNNLLKKYSNLEKEFISSEIRKNHYEYLSQLYSYEGLHPYFTNKINYKTPKSFLDEFKNFDFDNAIDFEKSGVYRKLCFDIFFKIADEKDKVSSVNFMKNQLTKIKTTKIKDLLIKNIANRISLKNNESKDLYEIIMQVSDDQQLKTDLTNKIKEIQKIQERTARGQNSPTFVNYVNSKGGNTSLIDFKGKYLFLDIWATWCGSCIKEFPYLEKIKKKYKNRNIEFIGISIDKEEKYSAWKKMVKEKELGGIQLFADNDWNSKFIQDYGISSIPRFILIDPTGKIIEAIAPPPSNPKLIEIFENLKI